MADEEGADTRGRAAAGDARRADAALGRLRRRSRGRRHAERLLRANRLAQLPTSCPAFEAAVDGGNGERDRAVAAMEAPQVRPRKRATRRWRPSATRAMRTRAIDAAAAALERIEGQRPDLAQRQADLEPVLRRQRSGSAAERALAALPDPAAIEHEVEAAREVGGRRPLQSPTSEPRRQPRRARLPRTASGRATAAREQAEWRKRQADAEQRLARRTERQRAASCTSAAELRKEPAELDAKIGELEHANDQSQVQRSAKRRPRSARPRRPVVAAGQAITPANESSADTRERRAAAAARAEAQQARSAEFARAAVEQVRMRTAAPAREARLRRRGAAQCRRGSSDARTADRRARADRPGQPRRRAGAGRARRARGPRAPRKPRS